MTTLSSRLIALRKSNNLSTTLAAKKANVSKTSLYCMETSQTCNPSFQAIVNLAKLYNVTPHYLFYGTLDQTPYTLAELRKLGSQGKAIVIGRLNFLLAEEGYPE
jgi:transcriptional regulator with XRE-family HTH domain